ncbi:MAG TPA: sulfotransferase [Caulobacteraceae bacterium]
MTTAPTTLPRWRRLFQAADAHVVRGASASAIAPLEMSLRLNPRQPAAWRLASDLHVAHGDLPAAWAARQQVGDSLIDLALAQKALSLRDFVSALAALDRHLASFPGDVLALAMQAATLLDLGRPAEAAEITGVIAARFGDQPHSLIVHAGALRACGESEAAAAVLVRCTQLPGGESAWQALADIKTYRFSSAESAALEQAVTDAPENSEERARLAFALGKAKDDAEDTAAAWASYAEGNAIEARRRNFRLAESRDYARRCQALFTPEFFAERDGWGAPTPGPIFIVGLPRSGSTLVEQIIASHSAIEGLDERPDLPMLAASVPAYPEGVAVLDRGDCGRLGEAYRRATAPRRRTPRPFSVDKTPKNFLHLGFIRLILPAAKIIDVRRHPLDCGVSIFKQHFGTGFASAFDLGDIGGYYALYVEMMRSFAAACPGVVHTVIYEDLVADPDRQTLLLLKALGLPLEEACLRFFDNPRIADTPSAEQVRKPITTAGVGAWRRHEPWLDPLKAALGPALETWRH